MVRGVLWRSLWLWIGAPLGLIAGLVAYWDDGPPELNGACAAVLILLPLFLLFIWRAHFKNTVGRFRSLDSPEADMVLDEAGLGVTSSLGAMTIPWSRFTEVWELPGFWMLFLSRAQFITLPLATVPEDAIGFLRGKLPATKKRGLRL